MIRKMKRVYLLYTQDRQDELVECIQRLGLLHLEQVPLEAAEEEQGKETALHAKPLEKDRRQIESSLIQARGICDLFAEVDPKLVQPRRQEGGPKRLSELHEALRTQLKEMIETRLKALVSERRALRDQLTTSEQFTEITQVSESLIAQLPRGAEYRLLPAIADEDQAAALRQVDELLQRHLEGKAKLVQAPLSDKRIALLISLRSEYASMVGEYLQAKGIRSLALPTHLPPELEFAAAIAELKRQRETIPGRLQEIEAQVHQLAQAHATDLVRLTEALDNRLAQLDATGQFGYTEYTLLISGWVPQDEWPHFKHELSRQFPGIILKEERGAFPREEVPVAFQNPPWVRPYELFLSILPLPKYNSVDPTPFFTLFFPVFFGIILGDIGYGSVMLALGLWARRRFAHRGVIVRDATTLVIHAAAVSMVLGVVFGEFFGLPMPWPHFSRLASFMPYLLFSVALGAVQVVLGLILGVINGLRNRHPKHYVAQASTLLMLVGLSLLLGVLMGVLPPQLRTPGVALLIVALGPLIWGGGFMGVFEFQSVIVSVISYARLMGFGLASVVLAELADGIAGSGIKANWIMAILGILAAILVHSLNFGLGLFEGTIQSARLHYVEFFQRFFLEEAGGKAYQPFRERSFTYEES